MTSDANYGNIPQELKELRQWVCYRTDNREGKPTKVPYQADCLSGVRAKCTDPTTWYTFGEVVTAAGQPSNRYDGIGFVLSESDPYTFIDLDHVITDGKTEAWAGEIIRKVGSYAEFSQSGTGVHIIARAKKPGPKCRTKERPKFEVYDQERFSVFTGCLYPGSPAEITDAQEAVDEVYSMVFGHQPKAPARRAIADVSGAGVSDTEIIEKAMSAENGGKFRRLWAGDASDYNGDASAADMGLCCMLAFWTGRDPARMDALFRQSGLMRDKWDKRRGDRTYGQRTINVAIQNTAEVYDDSDAKSHRPESAEHKIVSAHRQIARAKAAGTAAAIFDVVDALAALPPGEYADVAQDLKQTIPQIDLRALKGAVSKAVSRSRVQGGDGFPELIVSNRQLRDMGDEAIERLREANVPPTLFVRSGALCQVIEDERGRPIIRTVSEDVMLSRLAKTCNFVSETADGSRNVQPPKILASYVLSEDQWPFPALDAISQSPTIRPDGSIAQLPGYDAETGLFYHCLSGDQIATVPASPSDEDVSSALRLIEELLMDFPFETPASKANAMALLLTPVMQPAVGDVSPIFLVDAPTAGSGKSLLATVAGIISTGAIPDFTTAPAKEEEWPKKITAILSSGPSLVVIDNVKYTLQSADLACVLTARTWKDRVFGKNTETIVLPNRVTWVATGNNIQLGGDIPRRCVWIRIDPRLSKPHERDGFLHPNLPQWVLQNRGSLLAALLTICRAWYAAGCPTSETPKFGSFERWSQVIGDILGFIGITGFLGNRDQLWEQSDTESTEWEMFLSKWDECYGSNPISPKDLVRDIEAGQEISGAIPVSVSDAVYGKGDKCSRLGFQLKARLGKRYGIRGFMLQRGPKRNTGITWMVVTGDDELPLHIQPSTDSPADPSTEVRSGEGCGGSQILSAGSAGIRDRGGERIPADIGSDPANPSQPSTIHLAYECQRPGCGLAVGLNQPRNRGAYGEYECRCGHRGVVTKEDYQNWVKNRAASGSERDGGQACTDPLPAYVDKRG